MLAEPREASSRASTFTLTRAQPHHRLDLTTVFPDNSPTLQTKAIFELRGDTLTYCVAPPGQPRPRTFATTPADGHTLAMLKRVREK